MRTGWLHSLVDSGCVCAQGSFGGWVGILGVTGALETWFPTALIPPFVLYLGRGSGGLLWDPGKQRNPLHTN